MKKRLYIGLGAVGALLLAWLALRPHPDSVVYQGNSVRVWAVKAADGDTNAVAVLRQLGPEAVPGLVRVLQTRENFFRKQALALGPKLPRRFGRALLSRVGPPNAAGYRTTGARALGFLGAEAESALDPLFDALRDPSDQVRWEAATALSRIGRSAVPRLTELMAEKDQKIRNVAAYALGQIGPEAETAIPVLIESLNDTNRDVRSASAYSLAMIGFPSLLAISNTLDHGDAPARDAAVQEFLRLQRSIRLMVVPLVKMAQASDPASRARAIAALGAIRIPDDVTMRTLIGALKDPAPEVRLAAVKSLYSVFWRAHLAVPELLACLHDESPEVREWAVRTLGHIGPAARSALPQLQSLAANSQEPLNALAKQAAEKIENYPGTR